MICTFRKENKEAFEQAFTKILVLGVKTEKLKKVGGISVDGCKVKEDAKEAEGKSIYKKRKKTVEPVFGIIKSVMGFRQFMLRGLNNVNTEWALVRLAYNCKRLHKLLGGRRLSACLNSGAGGNEGKLFP